MVGNMANDEAWTMEPQTSLASLQMSLFGEDLSELQAREAEQAMVDAIESAMTRGGPVDLPPAEPAKPRRTRRVAEPEGPELNLDDENLQFFWEVGCRMLLAEMVIQTVLDMAALKDAKRCARLQRVDPQSWEEVQVSAAWFDTVDGRLAVQVLFPDWDHDSIITRVKADPEGVLGRFQAWASLAPKRAAEDAGGMDSSRLVDVEVGDWGSEESTYACRA